MPGAQRTRSLACEIKITRVSPPGVRRTFRHSPHDGFTAYSAFSPAIGFLSPSPAEKRSLLKEFAPASRHQDHTASPYARRGVRLAHDRRPSHPASNVRDDRECPSCGRGTRGKMPVICPSSQLNCPRHIGTTGTSGCDRKSSFQRTDCLHLIVLPLDGAVADAARAVAPVNHETKLQMKADERSENLR